MNGYSAFGYPTFDYPAYACSRWGSSGAPGSVIWRTRVLASTVRKHVSSQPKVTPWIVMLRRPAVGRLDGICESADDPEFGQYSARLGAKDSKPGSSQGIVRNTMIASDCRCCRRIGLGLQFIWLDVTFRTRSTFVLYMCPPEPRYVPRC